MSKILDLIARCGYLNKADLDKTNLNKALFIDRDGTIHIDKVETHKIEDLEFFEDVFNLFKTASELGYKIVVVTNQSGIGKGHYSVKEMQDFNDYMMAEMFHLLCLSTMMTKKKSFMLPTMRMSLDVLTNFNQQE